MFPFHSFRPTYHLFLIFQIEWNFLFIFGMRKITFYNSPATEWHEYYYIIRNFPFQKGPFAYLNQCSIVYIIFFNLNLRWLMTIDGMWNEMITTMWEMCHDIFQLRNGGMWIERVMCRFRWVGNDSGKKRKKLREHSHVFYVFFICIHIFPKS